MTCYTNQWIDTVLRIETCPFASILPHLGQVCMYLWDKIWFSFLCAYFFPSVHFSSSSMWLSFLHISHLSITIIYILWVRNNHIDKSPDLMKDKIYVCLCFEYRWIPVNKGTILVNTGWKNNKLYDLMIWKRLSLCISHIYRLETGEEKFPCLEKVKIDCNQKNMSTGVFSLWDLNWKNMPFT